MRNFFNTYQTIARLYYSYILENSLEEKLCSGEITAKDKDLKNILHQKLYRQIRESFDIGSQTVQEVRDVVVEVINSYAQLIRKGKKASLPKVEEFTVRLNYPRVVSVFEHGKEFDFFFKVKINRDKRIAIPIECGKMQKQLFKDALNGKYKIGAFQLIRRDGCFYFGIPIKKEVELKRSYDGVVGVDLGLRCNAVITLLYKNGKIIKVEFVKYRKLMHKIRMLWHRIDELKSMLPEGQRTSKRIRRLWKRIRRVNDWIAHNISKKIVEIAKENNSMIAMENLKRLRPVRGKNSRKNNRRISSWVRGRVIKYTIYKARWEGIRVKLVSPKNTL
ncbi:MAG: RNA-guided endonuclease TnpB family protein [Candidatus Asgardarchaeia archaeon]